MKRFLALALLSVAALPGLAAHAWPSTPNYNLAQDGPVPPELAHPGTIFVANGASDIARFSYTFTGDASRAYTEFRQALSADGGYHLVAQPDQADLVLLVKTSSRSVFGYNGGDNSMSQPCLRLVVIDRRTNIPIWSMIQPINFAFMHKNRDKEFEHAMHRLVGEFEAFTGTANAAPPNTAPTGSRS